MSVSSPTPGADERFKHGAADAAESEKRDVRAFQTSERFGAEQIFGPCRIKHEKCLR